MKKIACLLLALLTCLALMAPVFAVEDDFVPSITYKPEPEFVPVLDENQEEHIGVIKDTDGTVLGYVDLGCLTVTPIANIWDESKEVPEDVRNLLQFVYDGLNDGSIVMDYTKYGEEVKGLNMVIRDLFDARFYCEDCPKMLEPEGVVMELTFDLGVVPEVQVYVQTFNEETNGWEPIVKTVNNGDGTVTCTFEHLCVIAFSMPVTSPEPPVEEPAAPNLLWWILALLVAVVLIVVIVVVKNKKKKAAV